jgi:large subunit ribosomal protein L21e
MPSSDGPLKKTKGKLKNEPRERGTSPPQRAVEEFEAGQKVHLKIDPSVPDGRFHPKFNGKTGQVTGTQGAAYAVEVADGGATKTLLAKPAHLRAQQE